MEHFGIYGSGTLYNAMNLEQINEMQTINYREKLGLKVSDFIVTYVGRVVGGKGILELNQAMKKINKKINAYLIIAGDGPYMKEVEKKKEQIQYCWEELHMIMLFLCCVPLMCFACRQKQKDFRLLCWRL